GDVPDWRGLFSGIGALLERRSRRIGPFRSPARAQLWLEWQRHGRSLPVFVALLVPFELMLMFVARRSGRPLFLEISLLFAFLTPPALAVFAAATVRKSSPDALDSHGLTPFAAARPMTSAGLVAAKLLASAWSALSAWAVVLVAVLLGLTVSG